MDDQDDLTISILIEWLEKIRAEHGDLPVYSWIHDQVYEAPLDKDDPELKGEHLPEHEIDDYLPKRVLIGY